MKPILTLTDFIENKENGKYSIELVGTINRKVIKLVTRPIQDTSIDKELKTGLLIRALGGLTLQAATSLSNERVSFSYPTGMNVNEQLSLFDLKQTTTFNNDLHNAGMETNVILLSIW